jgi:hypothetical protein
MEMTPHNRFGNISDILYVYNADNPKCEYKIYTRKQIDMKNWFISKEPYKILEYTEN